MSKAANQYSFQSLWRVEGTPEEAYRIMEDTTGYARWWPSVWLKVETLAKGDENRIGGSYRITTKGWLPYQIHWTSTTVEKHFPERIVIDATGDFRGRGEWTIRADGKHTELTYDWNLFADKPLFRRWSFLLKPLFSFNHQWAMRRGLESLKLELLRRRAPDDAARALVAAPPGPVFWFGRPRELRENRL